MNPSQIIEQTKVKFQQAAEHFADELKKLRTGRANAGMLDGIMVEAYGTQMPLNQTGTISVPEAQLLQITPFDPTNLQAIVGAIRDNPSLGLNPMDNGRVVRVPIPALNEERRREITKQLGEKVENSLVSLRNVRHEALRDIDQAKKDKVVGEDDADRLEKQIDTALNLTKNFIESSARSKETEIMTV